MTDLPSHTPPDDPLPPHLEPLLNIQLVRAARLFGDEMTVEHFERVLAQHNVPIIKFSERKRLVPVQELLRLARKLAKGAAA